MVEPKKLIVFIPSIEDGGVARWDTSSNSALDLLEGESNSVHEMIISGDVIYIATCSIVPTKCCLGRCD